ncbi:ATP-binding cassette domain-containing protein [Aeromicrobium tamlense]|uniref:ATP-binding cassette domain-containing protein n=1 Tax=Aeromicrobium tamlense TaxID=375541 RepID=A0A8I0FZF7_9ACTN|nr:ATP-binding cassette domain-containing protein [Aeromicrobium tamlense]MBD1270747.1 ATP-binding cassette domain-containing protein [Aeromicrobium tamlense]MBD1271121.1 ATP-binding cassette domain-containing protein [Aeromicrobium tamlense]NYI38139.1 branched-chain amino acid transport system ATP-binding protein [Aeromicrobium tamlense]
MSRDNLLTVRGLAVAYGAARVVDHLDLTVSVGEIVALVGPNGAGKTSTLRALSAMTPHRAEEISLAGTPLPRRPDATAARGLSHVPEGRGLISTLTVRQNIELGAAALGRRLSRKSLGEMLTLFPAIEPHLDRKAGDLSGGQQQMIAVARGLAADARVLMVDELSLGLAPAVVSDLLIALRGVADDRGVGLLLVDQNVRALAQISDTALTIRDGRGVAVDLTQLDVMHSDYLGRPTST